MLRILPILLLISCGHNNLTLNDFSNYKNTSLTKVISPADSDFVMSIPAEYNYEPEATDNNNILYSFKISTRTDQADSLKHLVIQKVKSFEKNSSLQDEFEFALNYVKNYSKAELIESGSTELINHDSYFIHTRLETNHNVKNEIFTFIIPSELHDTFYYLAAVVPIDNNLKTNLATLIQSIGTFKKIKN